MTKKQFIKAMELRSEIFQRAKDILENHDFEDVVEINGVSLQGDNVIIKYTYKWDWEFLCENFSVPLDEFVKEEQ